MSLELERRSRCDRSVISSRRNRVSQSIVRGLALSAGVLLATGCYSYVPTELEVVPPGDHVRLLVTRAGSEELARVTESTELRPVVQGRFVGLQDRSLLLEVPVLRDPEGLRPQINQMIRIPEGEVLTVDRREFSRRKSVGLVAFSAGAVTFLLTQVFDVFSDGPGRDGGDVDLSIGTFSIGRR